VSAIAVLSDIHGNRQALDAVLDDVAGRGISRWWCVGDIVGYGADPGYALDVCLSGAERCIAGNHDLVVAGHLPLEAFASWAQEAAAWTRIALGPEQCARLATLEPTDSADGVDVVHASVRDPVWEYVVGLEEAGPSLDAATADVTFIGHTHIPAAWHRFPDGTVEAVSTKGPVTLIPGRWLVNPGSVGQPRDRDPRAAWACFRPEHRTVDFLRTRYDVAGAQAAIRAAGLPDLLADRLADGF
jgi:predicted phosphodiesterase